MARHQGSFSLDSELLDRLDEIAEEETDGNRSEAANQLLWEAVQDRETAETVTVATQAGTAVATLVLFVTFVSTANIYLPLA